MDKRRWLGGALSPGPPPRRAPRLPPHTRYPLTHTHSRKRLRTGRSGLAAWPLGAIQAPGAEAFWGSCRRIEGFGVLHGEAGGPAWAGQEGSRWEHRRPTRRTGSESCRVLFAWLLRAAGSRLRPAHWSGFRVSGRWGGGQRADGETKAARDRPHKGRGRPWTQSAAFHLCQPCSGQL